MFQGSTDAHTHSTGIGVSSTEQEWKLIQLWLGISLESSPRRCSGEHKDVCYRQMCFEKCPATLSQENNVRGHGVGLV